MPYKGDFGISYAHKIQVTDIIGERLGNTVLLALLIYSYLFNRHSTWRYKWALE